MSAEATTMYQHANGVLSMLLNEYQQAYSSRNITAQEKSDMLSDVNTLQNLLAAVKSRIM
jgi:hypothetical protein